MKKSEFILQTKDSLAKGNIPRPLERSGNPYLSANDRYMITAHLVDVFIKAGMFPPLTNQQKEIVGEELIIHSYSGPQKVDWEPEEDEVLQTGGLDEEK